MWRRYNVTLQRLSIALRRKQKILKKTDRALNNLVLPQLSCFIKDTILCSSPVIGEPGLVVHVISPATGHLHVLCLQPVRLPASCHHFCPLNIFSSFSFKFKLCFPREAFPDLLNPYYMLLEYRFLLLFSAITTSVLHEIEWLFDRCSLSLFHNCLGRVVSICAHHCIPSDYDGP